MELDNASVLWTAAGEGQISEIRRVVEQGVDINQLFFEGITALHFATLQGNIEVVTYLIEQGADVNRASENGVTPLMSACSQGLLHIAKFLVQAGAHVNAINANMESPLLYLSKARQRRAQLSTNRGSLHGFNKVCYFEATCGCLELVRLLVDNGANVNLQDKKGSTALMGFIASKHSEVAKFLIRSGTDPNIIASEGNTALLLASKLKFSAELIQVLLQAGADVNCANSPEGTTPLMSACYTGVDIVEILLQAGATVNAMNCRGETALKCAVFASDPAVIESLIKAGVHFDKELILATFIGHKESIQTLVTNGVFPRESHSIKTMRYEIYYLSRRYNVDSWYFLEHPLAEYLETLNITSLTPFMAAIMRKDDAVARYFMKNLFLNPLDIHLLQDYRKNAVSLEQDLGLCLNLTSLVSQPWTLLTLSFLSVSFLSGFDSHRECRILASGLPAPVQRKLLFRDRSAYLPGKDWRQIDLVI